MSLLEVKGLRMHYPILEGVVAHRLVGEVKAIDGIDFTHKVSGMSARIKATITRAYGAAAP